MRVEQHPALNQVTHYSVGWKEDEVLYCTDKLAIKEIRQHMINLLYSIVTWE